MSTHHHGHLGRQAVAGRRGTAVGRTAEGRVPVDRVPVDRVAVDRVPVDRALGCMAPQGMAPVHTVQMSGTGLVHREGELQGAVLVPRGMGREVRDKGRWGWDTPPPTPGNSSLETSSEAVRVFPVEQRKGNETREWVIYPKQ